MSNVQSSLRVLVVGATGGSGRAAVEALQAAGHAVTAFVRRPGALAALPVPPRCIEGDVFDAAAVERAVQGHDAVVVTLGISENALRVRLLGSRGTPMDVRSAGTRHVVAAMRRHGVRRLVVQSSYGVGETRDRLPFADRLFFALLLKPQIADTERQEAEVRASGLEWTLLQPVHLTDAPAAGVPHASPDGELRSMKVTRQGVGQRLAQAVQEPAWVGRVIALSDEPAPAPARCRQACRAA